METSADCSAKIHAEMEAALARDVALISAAVREMAASFEIALGAVDGLTLRLNALDGQVTQLQIQRAPSVAPSPPTCRAGILSRSIKGSLLAANAAELKSSEAEELATFLLLAPSTSKKLAERKAKLRPGRA